VGRMNNSEYYNDPSAKPFDFFDPTKKCSCGSTQFMKEVHQVITETWLGGKATDIRTQTLNVARCMMCFKLYQPISKRGEVAG